MSSDDTHLENASTSYQTAKRYLWLVAFVTAAIPPIAIWLFIETASPVMLSIPLIYFFGAVPVLDYLFGEDPYNPTEDTMQQLEKDPYFRYLLYAIIPVYYATYILSVWVVGSYDLPIWSIIVFAVGVGMFHSNCLTIGHELGHKLNRRDQWAAKISTALVGYGHFCIEHNRGHHVQVATPEDPASARMGESIYRFALREIPGTFRRGWHHEIQRLKRKGLKPWSVHNDILQGYALTLSLTMILIATFGLEIVPFIAIHHLVAWYGLTQANYVEHYGLLRRKLDNGRYEPCRPEHSWNTNHIYSNLATFHLQRHSDHHANPLRPYQILRNFPALPRLPSGYPGCFALAAIPPLWFWIMDPKVKRWAGHDLSRINMCSSRRDRAQAGS
ncbi:alkane 1-monooxygenase [Pseudovibrio exalbescens]|uniref:alkane 1-monooxygenase n=1 Tax=Pseudovibrio exalbescens TaxID=197461 RepID=UPI000C9AA2A2|nr:alkane 1-monooxygenase [Pseudovibrio exalbescens]